MRKDGMMMGVLSGLEPERVFYYFEEITKIPHGSGNTKAISDYCVSFALAHDLEVLQDAAGNVIIRKGASAGKEDAAPVMLQGHMDMVAAKTADCEIDMEKEGLRLRLEDGVISADGTTLGGDDGIAVAYMLALLESDTLVHPPLECVFTVDEEIGMLGAFAMDMSVLEARRLINLDSEAEGVFCVSCAGGVVATVHLQTVIKPSHRTGLRICLSGCAGGHSGGEISRYGANAVCLLGRVLFLLKKVGAFRIVEIHGGTQDNAIPTAAQVTITLPEEEENEAVFAFIEEMNQVLRAEYHGTDPFLSLTCEAVETSGEAFGTHTTNRVITALRAMPNGVMRMSAQVDGLVETSLNLGIAETTFGEVALHFCVRSSVETQKAEIVDRIRSLTELLGGYVSLEGDYPGMAYLEESPLRDTMVRIYQEMYGKAPVTEAIHAGLECGLFAGRIEGLDYISIGPDMHGIHTVEETLNAESAARVWAYLTTVLAAL